MQHTVVHAPGNARDRSQLVGVLDDSARQALARLVRGQRVEHRLRVRATIVWQLLVDGVSPARVASDLDVTVRTVRKWRRRYLAGGVDALRDRRRSGRPGIFTVAQRCEVVAIACDNPNNYGYPDGSGWTLDRLTQTATDRVDALPMSRSSIHRTLTEIDLRPHKMQVWLHSPDPLFKEKVNDVVSLYLDPPAGAVVVSMDEKTSIQALERPFETKMARPGKPARREFLYRRHGITTLLAGFNVQSGEVLWHLGPTRTADDLVTFMEQVAERYRDHDRIIVVWDNLNIHHEGAHERWTAFNARHGGKFEFHYTPIHASWVNQVEIFFSILQKAVLRWGSFRSVGELEEAISQFMQRWNAVEGHPFHWTFRGYPLQSKAA